MVTYGPAWLNMSKKPKKAQQNVLCTDILYMQIDP